MRLHTVREVVEGSKVLKPTRYRIFCRALFIYWADKLTTQALHYLYAVSTRGFCLCSTHMIRLGTYRYH